MTHALRQSSFKTTRRASFGQLGLRSKGALPTKGALPNKGPSINDVTHLAGRGDLPKDDVTL